MDRPLIDRTLEKINKAYHPGALAWVKMKRPEEWRKVIAIEGEINRATIEDDEAGLIIALDEYEGFILKMINVFKTPRGKTGDLF